MGFSKVICCSTIKVRNCLHFSLSHKIIRAHEFCPATNAAHAKTSIKTSGCVCNTTNRNTFLAKSITPKTCRKHCLTTMLISQSPVRTGNQWPCDDDQVMIDCFFGSAALSRGERWQPHAGKDNRWPRRYPLHTDASGPQQPLPLLPERAHCRREWRGTQEGWSHHIGRR